MFCNGLGCCVTTQGLDHAVLLQLLLMRLNTLHACIQIHIILIKSTTPLHHSFLQLAWTSKLNSWSVVHACIMCIISSSKLLLTLLKCSNIKINPHVILNPSISIILPVLTYSIQFTVCEVHYSITILLEYFSWTLHLISGFTYYPSKLNNLNRLWLTLELSYSD